MNTIRTVSRGAIINCNEEEALVILPQLKQIFPGYKTEKKVKGLQAQGGQNGDNQ